MDQGSALRIRGLVSVGVADWRGRPVVCEWMLASLRQCRNGAVCWRKLSGRDAGSPPKALCQLHDRVFIDHYGERAVLSGPP